MQQKLAFGNKVKLCCIFAPVILVNFKRCGVALERIGLLALYGLLYSFIISVTVGLTLCISIGVTAAWVGCGCSAGLFRFPQLLLLGPWLFVRKPPSWLVSEVVGNSTVGALAATDFREYSTHPPIPGTIMMMTPSAINTGASFRRREFFPVCF